MQLSIQNLSKAYNRKIIFRDLSFSIASGSRFAISGSNGAGKSTLLKILSGGQLPNAGTVTYQYMDQLISAEEIYRFVHFVAPYNTVVEELSLTELFDMHHRLGLLTSFNHAREWISRLDYPFDPHAQIKTFSSGMKQRIKLGISLLDDRPLILLDEPTSNLDQQGKQWFFQIASSLEPSQTLVIASNEQTEIEFCHETVSLEKK